MKLAVYLFALTSTIAWGAPTPRPPASQSAGVVERELEKDYEAKPLEPDKQIPDFQIDIPEEKLVLPKGLSVCVCEILIEGNGAISTEKILQWIESYLPKECSMQDIYEICRAIDQGYREKGYFLARSYPPPQKIEDGVLTIRVIEGKLGNIEVVGNNRYSTKFIESYFSRLKKRALRYDDLMRALLLLNENSDLVAGAVFKKGKEPETADLLLRVEDALPIHLYLNTNNYGRKLTTNFRLGGRFDCGNLICYGDMFSIAEVVGFPMDALYFTDVKYKIPLSSTGAFLEFSYLYSKFDVETLRSFHLSGKSVIGTVKGSYALTRSKNLSVDIFSYFDAKEIKNFAFSSTTSDDRLRIITTGFLIDHYNPKQGRDYLNVRVGVGIPNFLGGMGVSDSHSSNPPAGGRFVTFNADYDRLQHIIKDAYLYFHASGQYSPYELTVPEQLYIGGSDTVRGFPLACALGNSGYYANMELRLPPPSFLANKRFFIIKKTWREAFQVVGFVDQGGVFNSPYANTFIWGSGIGVRLKGPGSLALSLDVGFPLNRRDLSTGTFTYIKVTGQPF